MFACQRSHPREPLCFGPLLGRHAFGSRLAALPAQLGGGALRLAPIFLDLARGDLGDLDGRADHVAWRFSPRGPLGIDQS